MPKTNGIYTCEKASRYLQQLCKHWSHKHTVTFDKTDGHINFGEVECQLWATEDHLKLEMTSENADVLEHFKEVLDSHLERFAFREGGQINWQN